MILLIILPWQKSFIVWILKIKTNLVVFPYFFTFIFLFSFILQYSFCAAPGQNDWQFSILPFLLGSLSEFFPRMNVLPSHTWDVEEYSPFRLNLLLTLNSASLATPPRVNLFSSIHCNTFTYLGYVHMTLFLLYECNICGLAVLGEIHCWVGITFGLILTKFYIIYLIILYIKLTVLIKFTPSFPSLLVLYHHPPHATFTFQLYLLF